MTVTKLTQVTDGQHRMISDPPLIVPIDELFSQTDSDAILNQLHELLRS